MFFSPFLNNQKNVYPKNSELTEFFNNIGETLQKIQNTLMVPKKPALTSLTHQFFDPWKMNQFFNSLSRKILGRPETFMDIAPLYWQGMSQFWQANLNILHGKQINFLNMPFSKMDRRFSHAAWKKNPFFSQIKYFYLLCSDISEQVLRKIPDLDSKTQHKAEFYLNQLLEAMSPSNFPVLNPEVWEKSLQTQGKNLLKGYQKFLEDIEQGKGHLKIRTHCSQTFKVGKNLAYTKGKVVYQNDLMQLIQYKPVTTDVHKIPLFIVAPWINKFYIFDLQAENSFVQWALDQGYQVFITSWVNPTKDYSEKGFEDYLREGPLAALDIIQKITKSNKINTLGYCIGGTLLNCALAYLEKMGDTRVHSATFLTTLTDFASIGDLGVFIDEDQIKALEKYLDLQGYLDGFDLNQTFNLLAPNKMVWPFFINNYLLDKDPIVFDILHWNADYVHLPAAMKKFILRNMYLENNLIKPGAIQLLGVPIDLTTICVPIFMLSTKDDHIAPWQSTYQATKFYQGPVTFMLGGSGHTAGVINSPSANKYGYWINDVLTDSAEEWFQKAQEYKGSWWTEWHQWLEPLSGEKTAASPIYRRSPNLEKAPGSYVLKQTA